MPRPRTYDHAAILADYLAGMSNNAIAAKYGCAPNQGSVLAKRHGLSRSPQVVKLVNKLGSKRRLESVAKSPERKKLLLNHKRIAAYAKRHGIAATAAKFGYGRQRTLVIAKQHGWLPAPARYDQQAILRDYLDGMKLRAIAEKHGCNAVYPTQLAKRAGKLRQNRSKHGSHL